MENEMNNQQSMHLLYRITPEEAREIKENRLLSRHYVDSNAFIIRIYWALFISLTITGIVKILVAYFKLEKGKKAVSFISVGLSIIAVLFLAMAREPYAITVTFLLLLIKGILLYKQAKAGR